MRRDYSGLIKKAFRVLCNDLKVFFGNAVIINSSMNIAYDGQIIPANWGDDINWYFLKEIFQKKIVIYNECLLARYFYKNYLFIGSTLSICSNSKTIVCGAGFLNNQLPKDFRVDNICAVRGPLSRQLLIDNGFKCPDVYGDPAMLLKYYYKPKTCKKYLLGIIPHYADLETANNYLNCHSIKMISPRGYQHWHEFIDDINSCECVVSSSLHGLIIAESYGVPSRWVKFDNGENLDYFKFRDFYYSINKMIDRPYVINDSTTKEMLISECKEWHPGKINLRKLIEASPLKLKL